jgi:septal ring factor EnvC (AmiA/AmiB activator)
MKGMDTNLLATLGAAGVTGLFTYLVTRYNSKISNEAALLGIPLPIIKEQNRRIEGLQKEIDRMWTDLQKAYNAEQQCRAELSEVRHANRDLQQKIVILEQRLNKLEGRK